MRIATKIYENKKTVGEKVIYPELSYAVTGILFEVHKELGSYAREKQYGDAIEKKLKQLNIAYKKRSTDFRYRKYN